MSSTTNPTMKTTVLMGVKEEEVVSRVTAKISENSFKTSETKGAGFRFMARNIDKRVAIGVATNRVDDSVAVIWVIDNPDDWLVTSRLSEFIVDFDNECPDGEPSFAYVELTTANSLYYFDDPE